MRRFIGVTLATVAAAASAPATAAAASVAIVGSNVTVRPTQTTWTGSTTSATLNAAKNEFESFQVIVRSDGVAQTNVNMAMQSVLTGPGGATIANTNVTIYREAHYNTTTANAFVSDNDSPGTGEYPEALIPKVDPWFGQARSNSFPVNIAAGRNVAGWIDVFVPATQAAGTYTGTLRVTTSAGTLADVPISLTVGDWAMPSTTRLGGGMDLNVNKLCTASGQGVHNCAAITGGQRGAEALYARVALENRISIVKPGGSAPGGDAAFNTYTAPLLTGAPSPGITARLTGAKVNPVYVFPWGAGDAGTWKAQGSTHGFLDRITFYCDELNTNAGSWTACQNAYNTANAAWTGTAPANGNMPLTITSSIQSYNWAKANGYGAIAARITTLIPLAGNAGVHESWPPPAMPFPGRRNTSTVGADNDYPDWVGAGRKLWWYHSCMSMGCSPALSDTSAAFNGFPSAGIDQPPMMARALSWNSFTYDVAGEYYYEVAKQLPTAWTTQWDGDGGNHGDGTLFYPGCVAGCGGGPAVGGTKDIPIESIRLKRIRDSHEDYEYLRKAEDLGSGAAARTIARNLFDNVIDVHRTQAQLDAARTSLVALLPAASAGGATCHGLAATITGTNAPETITGTAGNDVIVGLGGADTINGLAGDDTVCAGAGFDTVNGSAGNDWLDGEADGDRLQFATASAAVTVDLTAGTATGDGTDTIAGFDEVYGSQYNDTLRGSAGDDSLAGDLGADTMDGRGGADDLAGGYGNDTVTGGTGADTLSGDAGADTVSFATAVAGITASLAAGSATGDGSDVLATLENVTGSNQRDVLTGNAASNTLSGLRGDDDLVGGAGADRLLGADGADTLIGQAANDRLDGGTGIDLVDYAGAAAGISGSLTGTMTGDGTDTLSTLEDVIGTAHRDVLVGNTVNNYMDGGAGDDDLFGGVGADNLQGNAGADTLEGQAGNDVLNGGADTDYVQYASAPSAVTVNLATGTSSGGAGADAITNVEDLGGSAYADTLTGSATSNYIDGAAGADTIVGAAGADFLAGGAGNDHITARDTLAETVQCGVDPDIVEADLVDNVNADCETVNRA